MLSVCVGVVIKTLLIWRYTGRQYGIKAGSLSMWENSNITVLRNKIFYNLMLLKYTILILPHERLQL